MKLKCLLVGHDWVEIVSIEGQDYLFTECDACGLVATAPDCYDCDGEGWVLGEDISDEGASYSADVGWISHTIEVETSIFLCPACDGYGLE